MCLLNTTSSSPWPVSYTGLAFPILLPVSMDVARIGTSQKWIKLYLPFYIWGLMPSNVFKVYPFCCKYQNFLLLNNWIIFPVSSCHTILPDLFFVLCFQIHWIPWGQDYIQNMCQWYFPKTQRMRNIRIRCPRRALWMLFFIGALKLQSWPLLKCFFKFFIRGRETKCSLSNGSLLKCLLGWPGTHFSHHPITGAITCSLLWSTSARRSS